MAETWYRGQSTTVEPSSPGGSIHDFGDGVYLTNSKAVAELYAQTRVAHGGGQPEVLTITLGRNELGRVLDLNVDPRWQQFLRTPQIPNKPDTAPENLIRMANENYGRFFEQFTRQNNIRLQNYEAVIGPEFVRGGTQLCILNRNGQASPLGLQIRARLQPVQSSPGPQDQSIPIVPVRSLVQQSRVQGIVGDNLRSDDPAHARTRRRRARDHRASGMDSARFQRDAGPRIAQRVRARWPNAGSRPGKLAWRSQTSARTSQGMASFRAVRLDRSKSLNGV